MRRSKSRPHKDRRRFNRQDPRFVRKREDAERIAGQEEAPEREGPVPWWERDLRTYGKKK